LRLSDGLNPYLVSPPFQEIDLISQGHFVVDKNRQEYYHYRYYTLLEEQL